MSVRRDVDLDVLAGNIRAVRRRVAPAEFLLVVKDDAYRHGLPAVVARAAAEGVRWFGAFDVQTGEAVRAAAGDDARVFVWTLGDADDAARAVAGAMDIGVGEAGQFDLVIAAARAAGVQARVHLKIDTGLHRNGFRPEHWDAALDTAQDAADAVDVEGVWSHIAEASDDEDDAARAVFDAAVARAAARGLAPNIRHLAASAAAIARPEFRYDLVRIGAFAYGIRPAGGPSDRELGIVPALTLRAEVREVAGADAVIGIGALDGIPSTLAGHLTVETPAGPAIVRSVGATRSILSAWPGARPGDLVTVYGPGRSATDVAELIDTIGEEIVLRTGKNDGAPR